MTLNAKTREVAAPIAPRPSRTLIQELDPILKRRLQLALALVLDPGLPTFLYNPASDEVVVISIEVKLAPPLVPETAKELAVVEDFGPVGASSSRHTRGSAVNVVSGRDLKVAALDVSHTEPVPAARREGCSRFPTDSLASTHSAHFGVFERSKNPRHHGRRPRDVVISHDGNGGLDLGKSSANLETLVCTNSEQDLDPWRVERVLRH